MRLRRSTARKIVARRKISAAKKDALKGTASAGDRVGRRVLPAEAVPVVFGCTHITSRYMSCQDISFALQSMHHEASLASARAAMIRQQSQISPPTRAAALRA